MTDAMYVVVQVEAAGNHTFFRDDNGAVYGCGSNHHGQLGLRYPHTHKTRLERPCRVDSGGPEVRAWSIVCERESKALHSECDPV